MAKNQMSDMNVDGASAEGQISNNSRPAWQYDEPICKFEHDQLDRAAFSEKVAKILKSSDKERSIVVGVSGSWGSGKTSLGNMIKKKLNEDGSIVFNYSPWMVISKEQLVLQYFDTFAKSVFEKDEEKRKKLLRMAGNILGDLASLTSCASSASSPSVAPVIALLKKLLTKLINKMANETQSLESLREEICGDLRKKEEPIVIIIDDIDRLHKDEIQIVFQLVRSIGNFPNVRYLLLYDHVQICNALKDCTNSPEEYLEKIITVPLELPEITCEMLRNHLLEYLNFLHRSDENGERKRAMTDEEGYALEFRKWKVIEEVLLPGIKTLRSVKRFLTTCDTLIQATKDEHHWNVQMEDFIALEYIRQHSVEVYRQLHLIHKEYSGERFPKQDYVQKVRSDEKLEKLLNPKTNEMSTKEATSIDDQVLLKTINAALELLCEETRVRIQDEEAGLDANYASKRFRHDAWRNVYFGFSCDRASLKVSRRLEVFNETFSDPSKCDEWFNSEWQDDATRRVWTIAICSHAMEIEHKGPLLLSILKVASDNQDIFDPSDLHKVYLALTRSMEPDSLQFKNDLNCRLEEVIVPVAAIYCWDRVNNCNRFIDDMDEVLINRAKKMLTELHNDGCLSKMGAELFAYYHLKDGMDDSVLERHVSECYKKWKAVPGFDYFYPRILNIDSERIPVEVRKAAEDMKSDPRNR